jgi:hypothetical protein
MSSPTEKRTAPSRLARTLKRSEGATRQKALALGSPSTHEPDTSEIPNLRRGPATCGALILSASASRTSVASNSATTVTPGTGSSATSTTTVSTAGVLGGFIALIFFRGFFAPRSSLALTECFLGICPGYGALRRSFPRRLGGLASFMARYRLCFSFSHCWPLLPLSHSCPLSWRDLNECRSIFGPSRKKASLLRPSQPPCRRCRAVC